MPLYLDRHHAPGATAVQIADAHKLDLTVQEKYNVRYVTYWFDDHDGMIFCLAEGPDRESLDAVHREAHGLVADNIIEVGSGPINAFLGERPDFASGVPYVAPGVRAILFTDICDSTAQTAELGDQGFMEVLRVHDDTVRSAIGRLGGREVKHLGDGIMASFNSVSSAVEAGIEIQQELRSANETSGRPLHIRIGISVGEPVTDHDDLFGTAVQLSSRLCGVATPGGIAVSNAVLELCVGKPLRFGEPSLHELKGFHEPVAVYEVVF
jgi:class 3 adenylate cyclase